MTWSEGLELEVGARVLLDPEAPVLDQADGALEPGGVGLGLFVIDCSWRRLPRIGRAVVDAPTRRALPPLETAYPRKSRTFEDPRRGLATVEALYAASALLGRPDPTLLDGYRFAEAFLERNRGLLEPRR